VPKSRFVITAKSPGRSG